MIFVDSSAWIGLMVPRDRRHEEARTMYKRLREANQTLVTSDYVLSETYTRIRYATRNPSLLATAHKQLLEAETQRLLLILWTDRTTFVAARDLFINRPDQSFSFVDCVSFVIAKRLAIQECFSFDRDFVIAGFRVIPES